MKEKSKVCNIFQNISKMIQNQFKTKIRILRTINGKEYFNTILEKFFSEKGIVPVLKLLNRIGSSKGRIGTC